MRTIHVRKHCTKSKVTNGTIQNEAAQCTVRRISKSMQCDQLFNGAVQAGVFRHAMTNKPGSLVAKSNDSEDV